LTEVKERLPHGAWLPWVETALCWSQTTVRRFMDVYAWSKSAILEDLGSDALPRLLENLAPSAVYELAKAPEATHEVAERVLQGEVIPPKRVKEIVREHQEHEKAVDPAELQADQEMRETAARAFEAFGITSVAFSQAMGPCQGLVESAFDTWLSGQEPMGDHRRGYVQRALEDLHEYGSLDAVVARCAERKDDVVLEQLKNIWLEASETCRKRFLEWAGVVKPRLPKGNGEAVNEWAVRGARIREARLAKGIKTGVKFASRVDLTPKQVSMVERGYLTTTGGPLAGRRAYEVCEQYLGISPP
jgi:hypothetical protein